MIVSGFVPTVFVGNCLCQFYIRCEHLGLARKVFERMPERDVVSWNAMVHGYAVFGDMGIAQNYFDSMPNRDTVSWNSLSSGYLNNGEFLKPIELFVEMRRLSVGVDGTTLAVVLKACATLEEYCMGRQLHAFSVLIGVENDMVTGSAFVDMYAKCKKLDDSLGYFHEMPERNWVSWSAVIAGCTQNDHLIEGLELFKEMQNKGIGANQSTFASVFRSCAGLSALRLGVQLHGHAIKSRFEKDVIVGTATLDMYAKCGSVADARKLFDLLPKHNLQSFNALIVGCARSDQGSEALQLFQILHKSVLGFDEISLSGAFRACAAIRGYLDGLQIHGLTSKSVFKSSICVANAIVDMYGKCGAVTEASRTFYEMDRIDAVSWNAIIAAKEQNRNEREALSLFGLMLHSGMEPDEFTYGSALKACSTCQVPSYGRQIHGRIIKSGIILISFVGSALIDMYCKCGMMEDAGRLHEGMGLQTMVSWNSMISGFSLQKESEDAQKLFSQMLKMGMQPDNFTYATVLDTCANLATIGLGKQIHAQIVKLELQSDEFISSTLIDMYSKCGNMQDSRLMFEKALKKDFVTWNTMICGYANYGPGEEAIRTFEYMVQKNVMPNHATFVSVLRACAHMGLVKEGYHYFDMMKKDYALDPQLEHYSCMVDIMGRSGQVTEALKLINEMPFQADAIIWRTLLSICKIQGNVEVAEKAADSLLQLDPRDSSAYILLSNTCADAGMWNKVSSIWKILRENKLKKEPGCSWIEVKDEVHTFLVGEKAHPRWEEMYESLTLLVTEMQWAGHVPDSAIVFEELLDDNYYSWI